MSDYWLQEQDYWVGLLETNNILVNGSITEMCVSYVLSVCNGSGPVNTPFSWSTVVSRQLPKNITI